MSSPVLTPDAGPPRGPRTAAMTSLVAWVVVVLAALIAPAASAADTGPAGAGGHSAPPLAASIRGAGDTLSATVLVGTGGLTWSDVSPSATPNLWALLRDGSGAALSIRSITTNACPIDGWLGLSAGQRAGIDRGRSPTTVACTPVPDPPEPNPSTVTSSESPVEVPRWSSYRQEARKADFGAELGTLGEAARTGGQCVRAIGPGAGLAAARADGTVQSWVPYEGSTLINQLNACPISLVDIGAVRDDVAPGEPNPVRDRAAQVEALDARVGDVVAAAPGGADVIVASLADAGMSERLRMVLARGPHYGPGKLTSRSTRQPGLVQAQDVTVTILANQGLAVPDRLGGAPLTFAAAAGNSAELASERLRSLVDYDEASHEVHALVPPFFTTFAYGQLVAYLVVLLVWRGKLGSPRSRLRTLTWLRVLAVAAASVPASTFLANLLPWWRFSPPMLSVVAAVGLFVALIATVALAGPWGRTIWGPPAVVGAVTMSVLALDVLTGSRLQLSSLMGLQPVVGGRFYGMGNVTFAIFATAALVLAIMVSSVLVTTHGRRVAAGAATVLGIVTVVIDGAPMWGADGGGPPAAIPAFAYLVLAILGITMTWRRVAMVAAACVGIFLAVGFLDWLRAPSDRSHLGRFIQSIIDGGALDIVIRKAKQNLDILLGNAPLTLIVPAALLFVAYVLARPTSWGARALDRSCARLPTLRAGLIALVVMLTVGFLMNDSGTAIPAVGATLAIPLIVAIAVRTLAEESRGAPPESLTRSDRRARRDPTSPR